MMLKRELNKKICSQKYVCLQTGSIETKKCLPYIFMDSEVFRYILFYKNT